jgi:hypothetical protein
MMKWSRGQALSKPIKNNLDLKKLDYKIIFLIRIELKDFLNEIKIVNNKYGNWDII